MFVCRAAGQPPPLPAQFACSYRTHDGSPSGSPGDCSRRPPAPAAHPRRAPRRASRPSRLRVCQRCLTRWCAPAAWPCGCGAAAKARRCCSSTASARPSSSGSRGPPPDRPQCHHVRPARRRPVRPRAPTVADARSGGRRGRAARRARPRRGRRARLFARRPRGAGAGPSASRPRRPARVVLDVPRRAERARAPVAGVADAHPGAVLRRRGSGGGFLPIIAGGRTAREHTVRDAGVSRSARNIPRRPGAMRHSCSPSPAGAVTRGCGACGIGRWSSTETTIR